MSASAVKAKPFNNHLGFEWDLWQLETRTCTGLLQTTVSASASALKEFSDYFRLDVEIRKRLASCEYRKPERKGNGINSSVTPLYALQVAAIYLIFWFRVSSVRSATGVSFGDGGDTVILRSIRQHGNCVEWMTFVLILTIPAAGVGTPAVLLHIAGALLLVGRLAHPFGLAARNAGYPPRYLGNGTNILADLGAMVCIGIHIPGL